MLRASLPRHLRTPKLSASSSVASKRTYKQISFSNEARQKMLVGCAELSHCTANHRLTCVCLASPLDTLDFVLSFSVEILAKSVAVTLGPKGRNAIIDQPYGGPKVGYGNHERRKS